MKGRATLDSLPDVDDGRSNLGPRLVLDPQDRAENIQFALSLNQPAAGVLAVDITPGTRRTYELAGDILAALGKRVDASGTAGTSHEAWFRACAWLIGERIEDIVVCRAHLLDSSRWQRLIEIAALTHARLWLLVHRPSLNRKQREAARDWQMPKLAFAEFRRRWRRHSHQQADRCTPRRVDPFIPDQEFPAFLSNCARLLDDRTFNWLSSIYWSAHRQALVWFERDHEGPSALKEGDVATFLYESLCGSRGLSEMLIRARAAQAASFLHGWLIKVNQQALAGAYFSAPLSDLDLDACAALRLYGHPRYASAAAISLASREPPSELVKLNIQNLSRDGSSITLAHRRVNISEPARGIIRAQLAFRLGEGADDQDPLFIAEKRKPGPREGREFGRITGHGLHQRLAAAAIETGLSVIAAEPSGTTDPKRWLRRQGLTVHRLPDKRRG